ncbi:MAG: T9SS type A sorting domain-containing protein, partial [Ignavibacteriaceae bacterium]
DSIFECSEITDEGGKVNYPFYWSSTTHANMMHGSNAAYVAFGEALGWMQDPMSGEYQLMDVHGAGAQRSDPKAGDPADYPYGHGPQGDVIRIYNYIRLVRCTDIKTSVGSNNESTLPKGFKLSQNYPNPFNPTTTIEYSIPEVVDAKFASAAIVELKVYDLTGKKVAILVNRKQKAGSYKVSFNAGDIASGIYFYRLAAGTFNAAKKMILLK